MSTDPTALAREVLDLAHEDETVTVCSIPDRKAAALARAVLAVAALADELEAEAHKWAGHPDASEDYDRGWDRSKSIASRRIRAALNGDPR